METKGDAGEERILRSYVEDLTYMFDALTEWERDFLTNVGPHKQLVKCSDGQKKAILNMAIKYDL